MCELFAWLIELVLCGRCQVHDGGGRFYTLFVAYPSHRSMERLEPIVQAKDELVLA